MQYYNVAIAVLASTLTLCSSVHGKQYCTVNQDFSSGALELSGTAYRLMVLVKTHTYDWSGTDANVRIIFVGQNGKTPSYLLDDPNHNDFEWGAYDKFYVNVNVASSIGRLRCIDLWRDNTGNYPGWLPEYVVVATVPEDRNLIDCVKTSSSNRWAWGEDKDCAHLTGAYQRFTVDEWVPVEYES